jgi:hypothetical protein
MDRFHGKTGLPNICEASDGTHVPLVHRASSSVTITHFNYHYKETKQI